MSSGPRDANAVGRIGRDLELAAHRMREAIKTAEAGHRGLTVDIPATVNEVLLPHGWKLVRAESGRTPATRDAAGRPTHVSRRMDRSVTEVWIVENGGIYDGTGIEKVFATREAAEAFAEVFEPFIESDPWILDNRDEESTTWYAGHDVLTAKRWEVNQ